MKIKGLFLLASFAIVFSACSQTSVENIKLETKEDSVAYAYGVVTYSGMSQQGWDMDPLVLAKGMMDARDSSELMDATAANGFLQMYAMSKQEEAMKQQEDELKSQYTDVIEAGEAFLKENMEKEGVQVTESGLQYKIIEEGNGPNALPSDKVKVHYTGTLIDGTQFDSSHDRGEPAEFGVTGVIKGWIEGLQLMNAGSKYMFYIPYDLGYGARGAGATITPFSTLVFEVELLEILVVEETKPAE